MRRRALLKCVPALTLPGVAGCTGLSRPTIRMDSGRGTLHPATDLDINNGLQPGGNDRVYATVTADEAHRIVGPDANRTIAEPLENPGIDQFHIVIQLRSSPDAPMSIGLAPGSSFTWTSRSTLRVTVTIEPWGSLDRIDADELRERLRSADELVYTGVWSLTPAVDSISDTVELRLPARG